MISEVNIYISYYAMTYTLYIQFWPLFLKNKNNLVFIVFYNKFTSKAENNINKNFHSFSEKSVT